MGTQVGGGKRLVQWVVLEPSSQSRRTGGKPCAPTESSRLTGLSPKVPLFKRLQGNEAEMFYVDNIGTGRAYHVSYFCIHKRQTSH